MQGDYRVGCLETADVARAFAIINHLFPYASFEDWQAVTDAAVKRRDWLAVADSAGVLRGLCYVFVSSQRDKRHLEVPAFASISLRDEARITGKLIGIATQRARLLRCDAIHIWPANTTGWWAVVDPDPGRIPLEGVLHLLRDG
jgi:hypothetical protein